MEIKHKITIKNKAGWGVELDYEEAREVWEYLNCVFAKPEPERLVVRGPVYPGMLGGGDYDRTV